MEKQIIGPFYFLYISTSIDIEKMVGLEPIIWYLRKRKRDDAKNTHTKTRTNTHIHASHFQQNRGPGISRFTSGHRKRPDFRKSFSTLTCYFARWKTGRKKCTHTGPADETGRTAGNGKIELNSYFRFSVKKMISENRTFPNRTI